MFKRKGKSEIAYSDEQTNEWLAWLAQQLGRHNQTIFLIEQLQPSGYRAGAGPGRMCLVLD